MKKKPILFVLELFIPVLVLTLYYVITDPFKFIRHYDSYYAAEGIACVDMNNDYVSTCTYDNWHEKYGYDSFIFGNSRSRYYMVDDWKPYLDSTSNCFHMDASNETLRGIYLKLKYINNTSDIRNCLLILDNSILSADQSRTDSYLFFPSPQTTPERDGLKFQLSGVKTFLNPKFLYAYTDLLITGKIKPYMREWKVFNENERKYDYITNETTYPVRDVIIEKGEYYTERILNAFPKNRPTVQQYSEPVLAEHHIQLLKEIKEVFSENNTKFRIIISPAYDQIKLAESDYAILLDIFGTESVFDFSGINDITHDYHNYYDYSHYTSDVCSYILSCAYSRQ